MNELTDFSVSLKGETAHFILCLNHDKAAAIITRNS